MSFLAEVTASPLLRRALVEVVLTGALCGAVGAQVLLRRLPFAAMTLTHAVFPGAVVAHLLGLPLAAGAWVVAPVMAVGLGRLASAGSLDPSTAAGVALSASSAWALMLVAAGPISSVELSSLLVGSVLTVSNADVVATAVGGTVVVAVVLALHKELVHGAFDPLGQAALGYPDVLDSLVLLLVAVVAVTAVPAVGSLLPVALLVAPAASARLWGTGAAATSAVGAVVGAASGVGGLAASHRWDVAAGGAVALVAGAFFGASAVAAAVVRRRRVNEATTTRRGCGRAPVAG